MKIKSDAVTSKDKDKCWKIIEQLFNSRSSGECRSSKVLRSCWDNLKKKTRKFFAEERMQLYKTGKYFTFMFLWHYVPTIKSIILNTGT